MKLRKSFIVLCAMAMFAGTSCGQVEFPQNDSESSVETTKSEQSFRMPDFYGMDYNKAVSEYGHAIQFELQGSEYDELDEGLIIEQDIIPDTEFKRGDIIKVKISKGMKTVEVPNVKNMNAELAKDQIKQRGLECEIKEISSTEIQKGHVINTEPEFATEIVEGETVVIYVSSGGDSDMQIKNESGY